MGARGVPRTGFWNSARTLNQYFVFPKNGSKYYLKYTFLAFVVLRILGLDTPLVGHGRCINYSFWMIGPTLFCLASVCHLQIGKCLD